MNPPKGDQPVPRLHIVDAMTQPEFYPHRPAGVEFLQTHISFIFIAGDLVYKVKKPMNFGFLDFTSLEKRKFYCEEELRLNRRLAPETYLEVAAIGLDDEKGLVLGEGGRVVEYAVVMKRLPQERMLGGLLKEGNVGLPVMEAVAHKMADFHAAAATGGKIDDIGGLETVRRNHEENFEQTGKYVGVTISEDAYRFIRYSAEQFMERQRPLFERRVADHRIRDCHGDLHLEHICLTDGIVIFDCIEFNERFRYSDTACEIAFLAMDLDFNGYPEHADAFVRAYAGYASDPDLMTLLNFYKGYRAYVRGKVVSFRIDDPNIGRRERDEAAAVAARYFDLACTYASRLDASALILTAGLMGTGKSVLAARLATRLGAEVVRMDAVRKEMLGIAPSERRHEDFAAGIYSEEMSRRAYDRAFETAGAALREGRSVIIDASFKRRSERLRAAEMAEKHGADFFVLECVLHDEAIARRLRDRMSEKDEASDGRPEIFEAQKKDFDPMDDLPGRSHIVVDTSWPPERCALEAIREIKMRQSF